jgi:integrating conjugative element relaxase (TIGR03760 family)
MLNLHNLLLIKYTGVYFMFHKQDKAQTGIRKTDKSLTRILQAKHLLAEGKRPALLDKIKNYMALKGASYTSLCESLLTNLADYCQSLPETANSYYYQSGVLLEHALNRTDAALELLEDFFVHDTGALSKAQQLWQYALFSAALLKGIACLYVDYAIVLFDAEGRSPKPWNPLLENPTKQGRYYSYVFKAPPEASFRSRLNLLLAYNLMPAEGFAWIASEPAVLEIWLALLNDDSRTAGTLGAIFDRADAIAIARNLHEFATKSGARGGPYGRPGTFIDGGGASLLDKERATGVEFINWLTESLESGKIMINKAPLLMVPGGMIMTQELFQLFVTKHPGYASWQAVQKGFLALGLHSKALETSGALKQAMDKQTAVLAHYAVVLSDSVTVKSSDSGKEMTMSAVDFIHRAQQGSQFKQNEVEIGVAPLQKIDAAGKWQLFEAIAGVQLGIKT